MEKEKSEKLLLYLAKSVTEKKERRIEKQGTDELKEREKMAGFMVVLRLKGLKFFGPAIRITAPKNLEKTLVTNLPKKTLSSVP